MSQLRLFLWAIGTVVIAALVSFLVSRYSADRVSRDQLETPSEQSFHQWLHENLNISAEQERRLLPIEVEFENERRELRQRIKNEALQMAEALREHGADSPEVVNSRRQLTEMQGLLQQATLDHFFAMKEHLDEAQREKLVQWTYESLIHGHDH